METFSGMQQYPVEEFVKQRCHLGAVALGKMGQFRMVLLQERVALCMELCAQIADDGAGQHSCLPVHELIDLLINYCFSLGNFGFARFFILLDDLGQVVNVIQVDVIEFRNTGGHIPRHAEIDQQ